MKLEVTENLKLQYVNNIQTTTSQINNVHDSDTELAEKINQILNMYEKNLIFLNENHHSKNRVTHAVDMDIALLNIDKKNKRIKTNRIKSF